MGSYDGMLRRGSKLMMGDRADMTVPGRVHKIRVLGSKIGRLLCLRSLKLRAKVSLASPGSVRI